jgi:pimeloyl-ACP methyl ester carboxylesterase
VVKKLASYKNGNTLSYNDSGDQNGWTVLVQHGMIASINDTQLFRLLIEAGARVISIARPGYGASSPYEMTNIAEYADIVSILADQLGLEQFDVLGISAGAPYSYALGYKLADQVHSLFILSGTPALYDENVLSHWPYPLDKQAGLADLQKLASELFFAGLSEDDLRKDDIKDSQMNQCFGIAQSLKLRCIDWGFRLADVKTPVYMCHSKTDEAVPLITAEITAKLLPNCRLEIRENDVHFSQEVLDHFIRTVMLAE